MATVSDAALGAIDALKVQRRLTMDHYIQRLEAHAQSNQSPLHTKSTAPRFYGWPLDELIDAVPLPNGVGKPLAMGAFIKKHQGLYALQQGAIGGGLAQAVVPATPQPSPDDMLRMRMRWTNHGGTLDACVVRIVGDKAFVFVVQSGSATILEDDAAMFPSDATVTKLRLIEG